jgi:hypothetical protein
MQILKKNDAPYNIIHFNMITTPKADGLFFILFLYLPAGGVSTHFSCRFLFFSPLSFDKSRDTHTHKQKKEGGERE